MDYKMLTANLLSVFFIMFCLVPTAHLLPTDRVTREAETRSRTNICQMMSGSEAVPLPSGMPVFQPPTPDAQSLSLESAQRVEIAADQCRAAQRVILQKALNGDDSLIRYLISLPARPVCQINFLPLPEAERSASAVAEMVAEPLQLIKRTFTKFLILDHVLKEIHRYQLYHVDSHFLGRADHQAVVDAIYHGPMANLRQALCRVTEVASAHKLELDFFLPEAADEFVMPEFETKQMAYIHAYSVLEDTHRYLDFAAYALSSLAEVPMA